MSDVKPESGDGGGGGESTTTVTATSVLDDLTGADSPQIQTGTKFYLFFGAIFTVDLMIWIMNNFYDLYHFSQ